MLYSFKSLYKTLGHNRIAGGGNIIGVDHLKDVCLFSSTRRKHFLSPLIGFVCNINYINNFYKYGELLNTDIADANPIVSTNATAPLQNQRGAATRTSKNTGFMQELKKLFKNYDGQVVTDNRYQETWIHRNIGLCLGS